jgi:3-deoxy-D-manno-octulosonic-acid transferase
LEKQALPWHQRSTGRAPLSDIVIYLADTTGELSRLSQIAEVAFIGKSLPPNEGGQTPIEAAGLGIPVLMGPNMSNFKSVATSLVESGAAKTVTDTKALRSQLEALIKDPEQREAMGSAGSEWHRKNRGSCQRIADSITQALE